MGKSKVRRKRLGLLFFQSTGLSCFVYFLSADGCTDVISFAGLVMLALATFLAPLLKCENCGMSVINAYAKDYWEISIASWFSEKGRKAHTFSFAKHCPYCDMERE